MYEKRAMATSGVYRPSASIIIAAPASQSEANNPFDYNVLLFKRTEGTAFAKNHCVFPGGSLELEADESDLWLQYFLECGITPQDLQDLERKVSNRPKIQLLTNAGNISREITLRITAIRETFEEVGILICRQKGSPHMTSNLYAQCTAPFDKAYWQTRVHNNGSDFLRLCKALNVVPDLWCLHEWCIWCSPPTANRKFETLYYFVAFKKQPSLQLECSEVAEAMWHSPSKFLSLYNEKIIWLPPNLFYELSRLKYSHDLNKLVNFSASRANKGSTPLMLIYYRCPNGMVGTLAGDDFYPEDIGGFKESIIVSDTVAEFRCKAKNVHRLVICDMFNIAIDINIPPLDEHISPLGHIKNKL